jgi:hypothetical protein
MKKMTTLYKQEFDQLPNNKGRVFSGLSQETNTENDWVFTDPTTVAYRKLDGASAAIINGKVYYRYMSRQRKNTPAQIPVDGIPAQPNIDEATQTHPYWVPAEAKGNGKHHYDAFINQPNLPDGTYELIGPSINGNAEHAVTNILVPHNANKLLVKLPTELTRESLKQLIMSQPWEGLVFRNSNDDMCKLRRVDFKHEA